MSIKPEDVVYTAKLARLDLTPDEITRYCEELSRITEYMAKLRQAVADGESRGPVLPLRKDAEALRDDEVRHNPVGRAAVAQAPDRKGPFFRVPKVIGSDTTL